MSEIGILQNDPNRALRDRIEPAERRALSARDSLTIVLTDLHEAARARLEAPAAKPESRRKHRRH